MHKFRNNNLKFLIIMITIITIFTSFVITYITSNQYKEVNNTINKKIANIIGIIKENYTDIDTKDIMKILNSDENDYRFKKGKE